MGRFILLAATTGLIATALTGPVAASQPTVNAAQICDTQTARQERRENIPKNLLKAISLAETGRWDPVEQATFAWPWTVMALGQGQFFPTRQAALDYIHELQGRGITNIDVGCMQINLYYHGDAFDSIEQALDPAANTAYAASHLKGLFRSTGSWTQAAAFYHSNKPERAKAYKMKVMRHWNATRQPGIRQATITGTISSIRAAETVTDHVRMAELNNRRKVRSQSSTVTDPEELRRDQIAAWKVENSKSLDMGQLANIRRLRQQGEQRKLFLGTNRDPSGSKFHAKRRLQLEKWRKTGYLAGSG